MTHHDPVTGETHDHVTEERVVTPAATPVAPAPTSDQVNVNAAGQRTYVESGPSGLAVVRRIVGLIFGILIGLILLRFVLLLLGANSDNGIVDAIYGISEPLVAPFRGIFALETFRPTGNSVVDIAALVAIVGWLLIYLVVFAILKIPDRAS
jgi:uncharacterized protein YggT (Ycf19 family)